MAIAARMTSRTPARYLRSAFERSGAHTIVLDGAVDWDQVPSDAAALVIVESPHPGLRITGTNPGTPVLFWVHHGEHHLMPNLRLTRRYGADAVLLAHSWHLAHRFPVPVHRFPFAIAPELFDGGQIHNKRTVDIAMVAAGLGRPMKAYKARAERAASVAAAFPGRTAFLDDVSPEEVAEVYRSARIVLNDGGDRHYPITMRVFEALGSGALLLTEDIPGTDVLLQPGGHYVTMESDVVAQIKELLAGQHLATIAQRGHDHARTHHTYDHRVDQLLSIAALTPAACRSPWVGLDAMTEAVDERVDIETVVAFGVQLDLPDRVVWQDKSDVARLQPGQVDAVAIGPDGTTGLRSAVALARRYVLVADQAAPLVARVLRQVHPEAQHATAARVLVADLGAPGYRTSPR